MTPLREREAVVISAGGTFGMAPSPRGWAPAPVTDRIERLLAENDRTAVREIVELSPQLDSANATPAHWQRLVDAVEDAAGRCRHVVVVHGTDTMAYSAAAVAFALHAAPELRVIFTGAQRPVVAEDSDGPGNLIAALNALEAPGGPGVALVFDDVTITGTRAVKVSATGRRAFAEAPARGPLARSTGSGLSERFRGFQDRELPVIRCYPGISARTVRSLLDGQPAAVLQCYGYGNIPAAEPDLVDALARATAIGTVIVAVSQAAEPAILLGESEPTTALAEAGVIGGGDLTTEAALAKLHYLLGCGLQPEELRRWVSQPLCAELGATSSRGNH